MYSTFRKADPPQQTYDIYWVIISANSLLLQLQFETLKVIL